MQKYFFVLGLRKNLKYLNCLHAYARFLVIADLMGRKKFKIIYHYEQETYN